MTTQADRRRQVGAGNKSARQASGRAMRDDLRALSEAPKVREPLPVVPKRGSTPDVRGRGEYAAPSAQDSGSGIKSPLTETSFDAREYHEDVEYLLSTDYLLKMEVKPLKSVTMRDADGNEVVMNYAEPVREP